VRICSYCAYNVVRLGQSKLIAITKWIKDTPISSQVYSILFKDQTMQGSSNAQVVFPNLIQ
jgi:hypothetical protein